MTETLVSFQVVGIPKPQGSKQPFKDKAGNARMKESGGLDFARWRNAVSDAAVTALDGRKPLDGALGLYIEFRHRMPQSRPAADRRRGWAWMTVDPDTDKLVRAVGDALQAAGLIVNDSRFCVIYASKIEIVEGPIGATIEVSREGYEMGAADV